MKPAPTRLRHILLALDDLGRAVDDPGLAALVAEGWRLVPTIPVDEGKGPRLLLLLVPPRSGVPESARAALTVSFLLGALLCGAIVAGALLAIG